MADDPHSYPVHIEIPVAWGEMDAFGHLNNAVYFRYFESARMAYFERMGILAADGGPGKVGPILASTACRFRAPLTYPDTVTVGASIPEVGSDRFTMRYLVHSQRLDRTAAIGEAVVVSYDYEQGTKASLPRGWSDAIATIEGDGTAID